MTIFRTPTDQPIISVVVLARENTSFVFKQMMERIKAQTVGNTSVLVLDCNVPGDPYSLGLQEDIAAMADVQLLPIGGTKTIAEACNRALEFIDTPYVCFINSSDSWYPTKAERQLNELEADLSAVACICNGFRRLSSEDAADSCLIFTKAETDPAHFLNTDQFLLSSQVVYRTQALKEIGGFDSALFSRWDQDALIRLSGEGVLRFIADPLFDNKTVFAPDPLTDYRSLHHLMRKHYDILLKNRKQYFRFNMQLSKKAARCTLWLHAFLHFCAGILKAPFYALRRAVTRTVHTISDGIVRSVRTVKVRFKALKLRLSLKKLRHTEPAPPPFPAPADPALPEVFTADPALHNKPLAFAGNKTLRSVVIPDHMTIIHFGMFAGCKNLEHIVIPSTVMTIESHAFLGCENLRHVEFGEASLLTRIGAYAFAGCSSLVTLTLPCNISHMGSYAFAGCTSLVSLLFSYTEKGISVEKSLWPSMLDCISPALFAGCRSLVHVEFPEGSMLTSVGNDAFLGCASLHHVYLNGPVDFIGSHAFSYCIAMEGFVLPQIDAVRAIGRKAFYHCRSMTYFRLPYALKQITNSSFAGCRMLKYIKVPKKVLYIEPHAFEDCADLGQVILISSNTKYAPNAFDRHTVIEHT